jgi:tRNA dimethylallyltransferase
MTTSSLLSAQECEDLVVMFLNSKPSRPLITIIGPTASGKTALSIELALELQRRGYAPEIMNADSRQFYRHLDIGTAKITQEEMRGIPHHLLSVLDPKDDCSIAWFQREVETITTEMYARGVLPILVGGSMLYVSAIVDGLKPQIVDPDLRERLANEYDIDAGKTLHARLASVDPQSARTIPRENKVYLLRALEIFESTGIPKSKSVSHSECVYDTLILCLDPFKQVLDQRINERTKEMFARGWVDEVKRLIELGYAEKDPAMMSHGYREILQCIRDGSIESSMSKLIEEISSKGRQYAKRHRTWWKGDSRVHFLTRDSEPR